MADIARIKHAVAQSEEIADIQIRDEFGELYLAADGTAATVGVVGRDSRLFRRNADAYARKTARLPRIEQEKVDWRRVNAACGIARWAGWDSGETPFPHTFENALEFVQATHVLEQIEAGVVGHASFFGKPSTS